MSRELRRTYLQASFTLYISNWLNRVQSNVKMTKTYIVYLHESQKEDLVRAWQEANVAVEVMSYRRAPDLSSESESVFVLVYDDKYPRKHGIMETVDDPSLSFLRSLKKVFVTTKPAVMGEGSDDDASRPEASRAEAFAESEAFPFVSDPLQRISSRKY